MIHMKSYVNNERNLLRIVILLLSMVTVLFITGCDSSSSDEQEQYELEQKKATEKLEDNDLLNGRQAERDKEIEEIGRELEEAKANGDNEKMNELDKRIDVLLEELEGQLDDNE